MFGAGDLLAVRVLEEHGDLLAREGGVALAGEIALQANTLVLDRLAGPVQRAVGEINDLRLGGGILSVPVVSHAVDGRDGLAARFRYDDRRAVVLARRIFEKTVAI